MAKQGKMSSTVAEGGHYEASSAPGLKKGQFQQVGTFIGQGEMTSVTPRGTSVNSKSGTLQNGEN
jgi:hypothetical protein